MCCVLEPSLDPLQLNNILNLGGSVDFTPSTKSPGTCLHGTRKTTAATRKTSVVGS